MTLVKINSFVFNKSTRTIFHFLPIQDTHSLGIYERGCAYSVFLYFIEDWFLLNFSHLFYPSVPILSWALPLLCMGTSQFDLSFTKAVIRTQLI